MKVVFDSTGKEKKECCLYACDGDVVGGGFGVGICHPCDFCFGTSFLGG